MGIGCLVGLMILMVGCGRIQQDISHIKSNTVGLKRTVTLYNNRGEVIKTWSGRMQVEYSGAVARFIHNGNAVTIAGTFVIEEVD